MERELVALVTMGMVATVAVLPLVKQTVDLPSESVTKPVRTEETSLIQMETSSLLEAMVAVESSSTLTSSISMETLLQSVKLENKVTDTTTDQETEDQVLVAVLVAAL